MSRVPMPAIAVAALVAVSAAAWAFWPQDRADRWLGYVEGETMYIAAPVSGRLAARGVERGQSVNPGDALFTLDPATTDAETARLAAEAAAAQAQAGDLATARERAPELDIARAAQASAAAQLVRAQKDYDRFAALAAKGFVSKSQLDAARASRDTAAAQHAQAQAQQRAGELSVGRSGQQQAAAAQAAAAQAALKGQQARRGDISPASPAKGLIEQTFYNPGEWVPANSPVVAVLPDDRRKLRFFVPQDKVAGLRPGMTVRFTCDGCGGERTARIAFIAPRAEFTPPVIYSERARAKLVFMVEAALPADGKPLPLGLPVEVVPAEGGTQ